MNKNFRIFARKFSFARDPNLSSENMPITVTKSIKHHTQKYQCKENATNKKHS